MNTFKELFNYAERDAKFQLNEVKAQFPGSSKERECEETLSTIFIWWANYATTIADVFHVYAACPPESMGARQAYERWLELCTCAREAHIAYCAAYPEDKEAGRVKLLSFFPFATDINDPHLRAVVDAEQKAYASRVLRFGDMIVTNVP